MKHQYSNRWNLFYHHIHIICIQNLFCFSDTLFVPTPYFNVIPFSNNAIMKRIIYLSAHFRVSIKILKTLKMPNVRHCPSSKAREHTAKLCVWCNKIFAHHFFISIYDYYTNRYLYIQTMYSASTGRILSVPHKKAEKNNTVP